MKSNQCPVYKEEGQHTGNISSVLLRGARDRPRKVFHLSLHSWTAGKKKGSRSQRFLTSPSDSQGLEPQFAYPEQKIKTVTM